MPNHDELKRELALARAEIQAGQERVKKLEALLDEEPDEPAPDYVGDYIEKQNTRGRWEQAATDAYGSKDDA